jgi:hypothetical protein
MALWGNNDAVGSGGTVSLNYSTLVVTGTGTTFGQTGAAQEGDVIRFGTRGGGGTYFGDAVIVSIAGTQSLTIGSTAGLSGAAISGAAFKVSQLPKYTTLDSHYSETNSGYDSLVYGISTTTTGSYHVSHEGWVGVTTYMGTEGTLRVKKEVLVAMSGINTAPNGFGESIIYPTQEG